MNDKAQTPADERAARLAAKLRANLKRRKVQQRERTSESPPETGQEDTPNT